MAGQDIEALLAERENVADQIVQTIGRLGTLVRQQNELEESLRRAAERDGSRTNAFSTSITVTDAICGELTAAGLSLHRGDRQVRLMPLVAGQHGRYRAQAAVRKQVASRSVA
jgi:hypothetical protein